MDNNLIPVIIVDLANRYINVKNQNEEIQLAQRINDIIEYLGSVKKQRNDQVRRAFGLKK